ncbi:gamma-glutamyl cyclotransferase [Actibacterium mucosum KCTC 23349]|uniref:glutathione-specific gamma-glutamylcyclotransferase n=1 Tax=Actibacterium mucosum KCTC 23349 TaxID=1454373 RepID=A0A037ZJV2_9RHOB|nr:gamma-glutamylcyclotransferase [Actibacterium mucosum]KAJ55116.1 gamma-glutamyl cyclotransferase [Actibacterium mucosum KCTC 23349]
MTLWVFGYGSLIWNPGFEVAERQVATMHGYHRSFCMRSIHHRGTEEDPGLVLALDADPNASCTGMAFRVAEGHEDRTLAELRERELISSAYLEATAPVKLQTGGQVESLVYIIDPDHVQYCGGLPLDEQAQIIATAVGGRGPNSEYLFNTSDHLVDLGIADAELSWLANRVREIQSS